jgi:glycosyl transferase, family 25
MRQLLDSFDRIFVINLSTRADRRAEMDAQLRRVGLSLASRNVTVFEAVRPEHEGDFPSIGARGCFMSHLGVLKEALRLGLSSVLILEDDADFAPGPHCTEVQACLEQEDWAIFYGGYRVDALPRTRLACVCVPPATAVETAHFIAMRGQVLIASLIAYMEAQLVRPAGDPRGGPMHVDGTYSWFRKEHGRYTTLLAVPPIAFQRASKSDIAELPLLDRAWGLRFVAAKWRSCRNALRQAMS